MTAPADGAADGLRRRIAAVRAWLERLLLWRVWERMLEIEFVDRSVALAGEGVRLVLPARDRRRRLRLPTTSARRSSPPSPTGSASAATHSGSHETPSRRPSDIRTATGVLGLVLTIFFATSFTTALQRVYLRAWRRPPRGRPGAYLRGVELAAAGPRRHGHPGRAPRGARERARPRALRRRVAGRVTLGAVVVHRLVPAVR